MAVLMKNCTSSFRIYSLSKKYNNSLFTNLKQIIRNNYTDTDTDYYDIIIAGGGLIGTTLACALG